jgi:diguanylate cyclase (GGDEF)-like protein
MSKQNPDYPRRVLGNATEQAVYDMSYASGMIAGRLAASLILKEIALEHKTREANRDPLTKLYNRQGLEAFGEEWVDMRKPFVVIFYDLTNFKRANDRFGHEEGDILLTSTADIISYKKRATDKFARYGGDEFVGLIDTTPKEEEVNEHTPLERAQIVVDRTNRLFDNYIANIGMSDLGLGISIGAVEFNPSTHATFQDVINHADRKMMEHKKLQHAERGAYRT